MFASPPAPAWAGRPSRPSAQHGLKPTGTWEETARRGRSRVRSRELGGAGGHGKSKLGTAAGRAPDRDLAAVGLDQALDHEQYQAGAAAAPGAPEPPEDTRNGVGSDALALVAYRHNGSIFVRLDHNGDSTSAVPHTVFQQVGHDLADLVGVEPKLRQR